MTYKLILMKTNLIYQSIGVKAGQAPRKIYQSPILKPLGSVGSLTLKVGSSTDSGQAGRFG